MTNRSRIAWTLAIAVGMWTVAAPAHAYIDANTGSIVIQFVIGFFAAAGVVVATFWRRIVGFFSGRGKKGAEES